MTTIRAPGRDITIGPGVKKLNPKLWPEGQYNPIHPELPETIPMPKKRIRQSSKPLSNKLETEFGDYLHSLNWNGAPIYEQAITLRLANGLRFTVDWIVFRDIGTFCYEVKGPKAWDDAIAKLKMAASVYRMWRWFLVWKQDGQWAFQEVLP